MVPLATFPTIEEAERAGTLLFDHGIQSHLRQAALYIDEADERRAKELLVEFLGEPAPVEEERTGRPFHPCPSCGASDPLWYGKRKAMLFVGAIVLLTALAVIHSPAFLTTLLVSVAIFAVAVSLIPEYECRRCRRRWSKAT